MTIKKTEISAQHKFLKPIYLYMYWGIVFIYVDVHTEMLAYLMLAVLNGNA